MDLEALHFALEPTNRSATGVEDQARARLALEGIKGKRLTYRRIDQIT